MHSGVPVGILLLENFDNKAEIRREWFAETGSDGLIALSGAHLGDVGEVDERPAVRVLRVSPGGPAARGGLLPGDLILAVAEVPIARVSELAYHSRLSGVDVPLVLAVQRGATRLAVEIVPDEIPRGE